MCVSTFGTRRQTRRGGILAGRPSGRPFGVGRTRDGEQTPKVSKPTTTGGGDDDGVGGHRAVRTPTASNGCTSTVTMRTGLLTTTTDHTGAAGRVVSAGARSASVALRCGTPATASGATTSTSADKGGAGDALPEPRSAIANSPGDPRPRWRACRTSNSQKPWEHDDPAHSRSASVSRNLFPLCRALNGNRLAW